MSDLKPYKILSDTMCQRVSNILKVIPHTIIDNPEWEKFNAANPPIPYISNDKVSVGDIVEGEVVWQIENLMNLAVWKSLEMVCVIASNGLTNN